MRLFGSMFASLTFESGKTMGEARRVVTYSDALETRINSGDNVAQALDRLCGKFNPFVAPHIHTGQNIALAARIEPILRIDSRVKVVIMAHGYTGDWVAEVYGPYGLPGNAQVWHVARSPLKAANWLSRRTGMITDKLGLYSRG